MHTQRTAIAIRQHAEITTCLCSLDDTERRAVIGDRKILGVVPKTHLPNTGEFYEQRWFASARVAPVREIDLLVAHTELAPVHARKIEDVAHEAVEAGKAMGNIVVRIA